MRGRAVVLALLALLVPLLAGCGTASPPSPPAGVDGLVVPTPSPDPADFVEEVDNPWFPLEPGTSRRYDVADADGARELQVTVVAGPEVAGVATTARVSTDGEDRVEDWFAQDADGNVWWLGRAGEWRAGEAGAEAGLAVPATPRVGDGYRTAYADGVVEDWRRVESLEGDELVVEQRSDLDPGATTVLTFERGTGLVESERVGADSRTERLSAS